MAQKRNASNTRFGKYLCAIRTLKGSTQNHVAQLLHQNGLKSSQGLLAKYEKGEIGDPDPEILRVLAKIYAVDYVELVLQLVEEKYALSGERWDTVKKSIPQEECSFCKIIQESIRTLGMTHKH